MAVKIWVEVHPLAVLLPPDMKRWRVMVNGEQQSVHETEAEAEATARDCRNRFSAGWGPARGHESRTAQSKGDWKK